MYQIKIEYTTGDSFISYDTSDIVELGWDTLEMAKRNLKNIEEHYRLYQSYNHYPYKKDITPCLDKEWFVLEKLHDGRVDDYAATYNIHLIADNGNKMRIRCFWCGYFEHLISAEIISENLDTKFYA